MNRKIGMYGSALNICSVMAFAICMVVDYGKGSYFSSMFIAFGFILMICGFAGASTEETKTAGFSAMIFAGIYATIILLVYFAQLTAVSMGNLSDGAMAVLDYGTFGLFFAYDMLGYALMALSTFFIGFTIIGQSKLNRVLKYLLHIHGIFFFSCLILPMLGIFHEGMSGGDIIGIAVLEFWCAYFIPLGILSFLYFKSQKNTVIL